jgi:dihydrodipicolinate synthase/N-acetylneuraminate lyase
MNNNWPGLTVSIPLFFNKDDSIDFETLDRYITDLGTQKEISAIYSMAYNTRYRMLSDQEVLTVNIKIIELAQLNNLKCYVGHPYIFDRQRLEDYLQKIAEYNPAGISMLYPERYYGIDQPILEFLDLPGKFGMKSVLHEMKLVSGFNGELINWPEELLKKAIQLNSVIGVKEDSKDDSVAQFVLDECQKKGAACILAGGGKLRALEFVNQGLETWLNGTTMFYPKAIDIIYSAVMVDNKKLVAFYNQRIETPFFENVVKKHGWHIAHKAALEFFGYGERNERFPHPVLPDQDYLLLSGTFSEIKKSFHELEDKHRSI